ncbi:MAG: hypothetical protein KGI57_04000 [Hyphomicrobiales bacterium]|nr:hypothetical protein [Hyphomicrobiales bacterium]MDE2016849.1 hypothetical protein [Hyphomicrobiales bacterium]
MSDAATTYDAAPGNEARTRALVYVAVGLLAGSVIALQIDAMRVFSVGGWAHFGSLVVSLAMLGFGLASATMAVAKGFFDRNWKTVAGVSLALVGPLAVFGDLMAQSLNFNAIFLVSDPAQKWKLFGLFAYELLPFLAGAYFLGAVFLKSDRNFGRVYFADLLGAGLCGLAFLGAMYFLPPRLLILVPLGLVTLAGAAWFSAFANARGFAVFAGLMAAAVAAYVEAPAFGFSQLATNDYKGVAYARKFPDNKRVLSEPSPFGYVEIYSSSYLHFAPGLSDDAAFNLKSMPENAYLGLYVDGEGPSGIIKSLPDSQTAYFRYLPMFYPYLLKKSPDTFVVQFGGGISTAVALRSGASHVTVAEGNPAILKAFASKAVRDFTGDELRDKRVTAVGLEGRHYLAASGETFDVIDFSLADSAGLSSPGGFPIIEKFPYTREAFETYMRALKPGGVLSVTLWNKEEPAKSVLKLAATMADAAKAVAGGDVAKDFFVAQSYLSTTTVLYKRGGFDDAETKALQAYTKSLSFDEIYAPGATYDLSKADGILKEYRASVFGDGNPQQGDAVAQADPTGPGAADPTAPSDPTGPAADPTGPDAGGGAPPTDSVLPATTLGRLVWQRLVHGGWADVAKRYVYDIRPLTNDRPYFAAYVKVPDLPHTLDRLELLQDEWGYLLVWATLGVAAALAAALMAFPVIWGWRAIFSRTPGKALTLVYFASLGAGYIMVEVGLIAKFVMALGNATVSASVLITGMLVFSGLGALASETILPRARAVMPAIFLAIGAILIGYALFLDRALEPMGALPYAERLALCFAVVAPPAFLMGFPMPTAMTSLGRLGKSHMFIWAWGVNGCFSVIGAAAVPVVSTTFGLAATILFAGFAYLLALPAFFGVLAAPRA